MSGSAAPEAFRQKLRLGAPLRLRGGACVTYAETVQDADPPPEWQALVRAVEETELSDAGLLRDRAFEIVERGETPIVARTLHVREELRVTRTTRARIERIDATVRRAEAEIDALPERIEAVPLGEIARRSRQDREDSAG